MSQTHAVTGMTGRDPHERHRAATPLELLFDLAFVIAFSQISTQTAHSLELGHVVAAVGGFVFMTFAASWAWINYTWLSSAYDNDDIVFRLATLVEMIGVLVMALGVPAVFHSIETGEHIDNAVVIAGYVIMRVAAIALWLRAAHDDPARRRTCLAYASNIAIAQVFWIILIFVNLPFGVTFVAIAALVIFEMFGPFWAETRHTPTPWHPHHIAERYSLLVIIALGEVVLGTILTISAGVQEFGWTLESALLAFGGTALAFGLWWWYFTYPFAALLHRSRTHAFLFGYLHILVFGSVVAIGAGLHVAAQVIAHDAHVDAVFAATAVVIPVFAFEVLLLVIGGIMAGRITGVQALSHLGAAAVLAAAVALVAAGASLGWALVVVALSPALLIVVVEATGGRGTIAIPSDSATHAGPEGGPAV